MFYFIHLKCLGNLFIAQARSLDRSGMPPWTWITGSREASTKAGRRLRRLLGFSGAGSVFGCGFWRLAKTDDTI